MTTLTPAFNYKALIGKLIQVEKTPYSSNELCLVKNITFDDEHSKQFTYTVEVYCIESNKIIWFIFSHTEIYTLLCIKTTGYRDFNSVVKITVIQ